MKTKLAILLAAGLVVWLPAASAQGQATDSTEQTAPGAPADPGVGEEMGEEAEIIPSIVFEDTPLTDVVSMLARQAGINFVFAPEVTAPKMAPDGTQLPPTVISVRFENVSAEGALLTILDNYGLQMVPNSKTGIARVTIKDPAALPPLMTKIIQLKNSSPTNLIAAIEASISERGSVIPDFRTSQIVVIATEDEQETIKELVEKLDIVTKQVLIEAQVIETSMNPTSIRGVDWSGTLANQRVVFGNGNTTGQTTTTRPGSATTSTITTPGGNQITTTRTASSTQATDLITTLGNGGLSLNTLSGWSPATAFLNADGVSATLSLLNSDADSRVVATPRTVTKDTQTARLEVTRAFPIFEVTPGSANTPAAAEVTYTNLGTILEVTPRVSANSNIYMTVVPEVSNIDSKDTQTIAGEVFEANVYAIRRIETSVEIPNGNTLVMGGLMSNTETEQYTKVPLLGDIPGLGLLFRKESKQKAKANLIIFITPTIVQDYDYQYAPSDFMRNSLRASDPPQTWDGSAPDDTGYLERGRPRHLLQQGN